MPRYIDADKAKHEFNIGFGGVSHAVIANQIIDSIPTADVAEVKHSEWILHNDGSGTCKQCGFTQRNVWDYDNWQNFCGHCGAKMDGKGDSE